MKDYSAIYTRCISEIAISPHVQEMAAECRCAGDGGSGDGFCTDYAYLNLLLLFVDVFKYCAMFKVYEHDYEMVNTITDSVDYENKNYVRFVKTVSASHGIAKSNIGRRIL